MSISDSSLVSLARSEVLPDAFLKRLRGAGPTSGDYASVTALLHRLVGDPAKGLTDRRRSAIHSLIGELVTSPRTLLGHCYSKPRGYAGDFEIIDKIYTQHASSDTVAGNWDRYFHSLEAPKAVRNRKGYLKAWLRRALERGDGPVRMLNLASGPARDLAEFFEEFPRLSDRLVVDCVELDADAIAHARNLLSGRDNVTFHHANVFRYRCPYAYDLMWSAGLFDYFDDSVFERVTKRYLKALAPGGEFVVGNFDCSNPSLPQMVLQDWILQHRTGAQLQDLARRAGANGKIAIHREAQGVNLFLHMESPDR